MTELRPFFSYYGGKWSAVPRYPKPEHDIVIEPFAGSAGYALRYADRTVVLVERNPVIAEVWRYLIDAHPSRIRELPDVDERGTAALEGLRDAERWLIGLWLNAASVAPRNIPSAWARRQPSHQLYWGPRVRERIASQVVQIRHWKIIEGDYTDAPDIRATWFIDPPYSNAAGARYPYGPSKIDHEHLAAWCRTRQGMVIVCEQQGAQWLPFSDLAVTAGAVGTAGRRRSAEAVWIAGRTQGQRDMFIEEHAADGELTKV